jgi:hypothetical protein
MRCEESFSQGDFFEIFYSDEGIYFLCSKECSDKWASQIPPENESESLQQPSI